MPSRIYMCWMLLAPVSPGAQKTLQTLLRLNSAILILTSKKKVAIVWVYLPDAVSGAASYILNVHVVAPGTN
jgi:hypothetical protein